MSVVADMANSTVHANLFLAAPRERVFRALTDAKRLAQWWGSPELYRTFDWKIDLRPGGAWGCQVDNPATPGQSVRGEYRVVEPPRLLEYTWCASWDGFTITLIRIELEMEGAGTRLVMRHSGFATPEACRGHTAGWERVLGWLVKQGIGA
jgi:uncharacterized protein YndB with AHSA1/START domain